MKTQRRVPSLRSLPPEALAEIAQDDAVFASSLAYVREHARGLAATFVYMSLFN